MIRLHALGAMDLRGSGEDQVRSVLAQPRRSALLAYLALAKPRGYHQRDSLLGLFWPEHDSEHARNALSQAVHFLRRSLGTDAIVNAPGDAIGLGWNGFWCDAVAFEEALDAGRIEDAIGLYRGDLLMGFHIAEAPEFERWLEAERARLAARYAGAVEGMAAEREAAGDFGGAIAHWQRLSARDPFSSRVALRLMQALAHSGDPAGAVQLAREHEQLLRDELAIPPDAEVASLVRELESGRHLSAAPPGGGGPVPSSRDSPPIPALETARQAKADRRVTPLAYAALAMVILVAGWVLVPRTVVRAPPSAPSAQSVAVLPFVNIGGDTANAYFADGITEELINALARIEGLRVPGRSSSFAYQGKNVPYSNIGAELRVASVLEGSVRRSSGGLRVSVRLVNVADGYQIWSEQYDRPLADVVSVQEEIARAVASSLQVELGAGATAALARRYTANFEAYDLYLRGRFYWNHGTREALRQAIDHFDRAITLDSAYALAHSGLADAYLLSVASQMDLVPPEDAYQRARAAALRAIALDNELAEAYVSLGRVRHMADWDWSGAEEAYRRAIQLNPRYALAHGWYGYLLAVVLGVQGRADQGVRETTLAVELDPLNPRLNHIHGIALRYARRYDEAILFHQRAVHLDPGFVAARFNEAWGYLHKGMYREALAKMDTATRLDPRFVDNQAPVVAIVHALEGRRAEALAILREREGRSQDSGWQARAYIYGALGDRERTLEALDQAIERRLFDVGPLLGSPLWDPVRSDPRFDLLLTKAGLQ